MGLVKGIHRRYGWRRGWNDKRNFKFKDHVPRSAVLPPVVNLISKCSPVVDQGEEGSCTANAGTGMAEFLQLKGDPNLQFGSFTPLSRNFLYYNERTIDGDVSTDAGSSLSTCVQALATYGILPERLWPYNDNTLYDPPSQNSFKIAAEHKVSKYIQLEDLDDMKQSLAAGYPFLLGFDVYANFEDIGSDGIMPMPGDAKYEGGHAVLCVGYNDRAGHAMMRNSWGEGWGDQGYFYMPYDYLTDSDYCEDFWTIRQ